MWCAVLSSQRQPSTEQHAFCVCCFAMHTSKGLAFCSCTLTVGQLFERRHYTPLVTSSGHRCVSSQAATLVCCEIISGNCFIDSIVIGTTLRTIFDPKIGGSIAQSNAEALKANVAATLQISLGGWSCHLILLNTQRCIDDLKRG